MECVESLARSLVWPHELAYGRLLAGADDVHGEGKPEENSKGDNRARGSREKKVHHVSGSFSVREGWAMHLAAVMSAEAVSFSPASPEAGAASFGACHLYALASS